MFYNLVLKVTINDAVNVTTPSVKSIPYWAAHHCMGYIWSNPPPPPRCYWGGPHIPGFYKCTQNCL